ncbi:uncharacterized protein LOC124821197, partial [Vigna umbellata]|uniref:uncharacterized protein LOC124821197 n=1 Tax=Vigna umbellata TaxID=87088 RepID=UPI001F5E656C
MGVQESVVEYIGRIQVVVNAMRPCDKVVKDKKIVEKILRTLTPQYDHIIVAIEECKDLENMRVEELQNSLKAHEQRLVERRNAEKVLVQGTIQALQARNNQSYKGRGAGRGRGRSQGGRSGGRNTNAYDQFVEENGSEHRGGNKRAAKKIKNDEAANLAQDACDSKSDHVLLMSTTEWCEKALDHVLLSSEISHAEDETSWYFDTWCSNHMTGKKDWLIDLDTSVKSSVRFADNSVIMAEGAGKVLITRRDGKSAYVNNALYVLSMKSNLLSLGHLLEKGYTMLMQQRHIEVFDERQRLVIKAPLARNRTFKLKSKGLVKGVPLIIAPNKVCEGCAVGKQARKKFKRFAPKRAKQMLDVVHSNVCGPFDVSSLG